MRIEKGDESEKLKGEADIREACQSLMVSFFEEYLLSNSADRVK